MRLFVAVFLVIFLLPALAYADQLQNGKVAYSKRNYKAALKLLRPLADQGNAEAQLQMGEMYFYGLGVKQDYAEARKWDRKAADQGDVEATSELGNIYLSLGNLSEAKKWWRKANVSIFSTMRKRAENGDAKAQATIGGMYQLGVGVKQDYVASSRWFRRAADQDDADAQWTVGWMYRDGSGVKQDYVEAYFWWSLVAERTPSNPIPQKMTARLAEKLTPDQKAAVAKKVARWQKDHPARAAAPPSKP